MLHAIAAAAIEMAGAAIRSFRLTDALRHLHPVDGREPLEHDAAGGVALCRRQLVIGAGLLMADQAVDVLLVLEIEVRVRPIVAGMALRAHAFIAARIGAEIVDEVVLAENLARFGVFVFPGPVDGLHELMAGFVVAGQAGLRNLGAVLEGAFQRFELAVIRRRIRGPQRKLLQNLGLSSNFGCFPCRSPGHRRRSPTPGSHRT